MFPAMHPLPTPPAVFKLFYAITGVGLGALIFGFGNCLFDVEKVGQCADYSIYAFNVVKSLGDHIIHWFILFVHAVFERV